MKFKYSAFIDAIDGGLDSYLEQLGYEFILSGFEDDNDKYTLVANGFVSYHKEKPDKECASGHKCYDSFMCEELIDCRSNPQLFQAVTAMREDTDNQQFFIHKNGEFILCWQNELKNVLDNDERYHDYCVYDCHKATLEELITHFKTK